MGAFKGADDAEQEYRRQLLIEARKGKAAAKEELEREYHVRTYSAAERAKLHYIIRLCPQIKGAAKQTGR